MTSFLLKEEIGAFQAVRRPTSRWQIQAQRAERVSKRTNRLNFKLTTGPGAEPQEDWRSSRGHW
jgi:hypothetical protein